MSNYSVSNFDSTQSAEMPSRKVAKPTEFRLAVIGADRRGLMSLLAHQPEQGNHLVAACSLHPERLQIYRERCGTDILITSNYQDILQNPSINGVFICTPDHLHEEHCLAAIEAGKSIFLEKPMAITIEGCDRILRAAKLRGTHLYLGHNMRFIPAMQKMRDLISQGAIGQVEAIWCRHFVSYGGDCYFKDWHAERRNVGTLLLQKGAHDLDVIHWLAGSYTSSVVGLGKLSVYNKVKDRRDPEHAGIAKADWNNWPPLSQTGMSSKMDVEDHNMVLLQLENGVQASYMQCHYTPDDHRNYTVIGTEGRIENYGDEPALGQFAAIHLWNRRTGYSARGHHVFEIPFMEGEHGGADPLVIEDFLGMLRGKPIAGATPMDARMAVAAGYLGGESIRNGSRPFRIPPFKGQSAETQQ